MGIFKGGALRLLQTALYALAFCCAAIILGIFSYFLAVLADNNLDIPTQWKAVEGISGVAVVYLIATTLLTCCLAGIAFLSILGFILDILFMGGFIAIAILDRRGANSCSGYVRTPLGNGPSNGRVIHQQGNITYSPHLGTACKLNKAVFGVAIAGAVLFLITALMQLALIRHHKKEKRYGPGPNNDYTSGSKKRGLFARKNKTAPTYDHEKGVAAAPVVPTTHTVRPSHDTAYSGNTAVGANPSVLQKDGPAHDGHAPHVGYNPHTTGTMPNTYANERTVVPNTNTAAGAIPSVHGGYYTAPTGTARDF